MCMAKKIFHQLIWPQELVVRSPGKSEDMWKALMYCHSEAGNSTIKVCRAKLAIKKWKWNKFGCWWNWWKWWNNEYETSIWLNFGPIFGDMEDDQGRILPSVPLIKKMTKTKIDTTQVKCWVKISSKNGQKIDENGHWGPTGLNSVGPCVNTTSSGAEKEVHLYV